MHDFICAWRAAFVRDSLKDPYNYAKSHHQNYEIDIVSFDYGFSFRRWNFFKDGLCSITIL